MSLAMITEAQIKEWSPHAKPEYIFAFMRGEQYLREAGILDNHLTLAHFMAQAGGETDGLRITRENMNYTSVAGIRRSWRARASKHSDGWIQENLVRNPVALSIWAYGGRMGNAKSPSLDGYTFRGFSILQTTGRGAVQKYCTRIGVPMSDTVLDDMLIGLRFACFEWKESGCNKYACENDILSISKIINVGSAKSGVMPNGMEYRKAWFKKSWVVFGDQANQIIPDVTDLTTSDLRKAGSETIKAGDLIKAGALIGGAASGLAGGAQTSGVVETVPTPLPVDPIESVKNLTESSDAVATFIASAKGLIAIASSSMWILGIVCGVGGYFLAQHMINRRTRDARMGLNVARIA